MIVEASDIAESAIEAEQLNDILQDLVDQGAQENCCVKVLLVIQGSPTKSHIARTPPAATILKKVISLRPPAPVPVGGPRKTFFKDPGWLHLQSRVKRRL